MLGDSKENQSSCSSGRKVKTLFPQIEVVPRGNLGDTSEDNCEYYCIGYVCVKVCYGE